MSGREISCGVVLPDADEDVYGGRLFNAAIKLSGEGLRPPKPYCMGDDGTIVDEEGMGDEDRNGDEEGIGDGDRTGDDGGNGDEGGNGDDGGNGDEGGNGDDGGIGPNADEGPGRKLLAKSKGLGAVAGLRGRPLIGLSST